MTPDECRTEYNAYMKEYMKDRRRKIKRICPDCGIREPDKGYSYCSECGEVRLYFREVIKRHNYIKKYPDKYKEHYTRWNLKRDRRQNVT